MSMMLFFSLGSEQRSLLRTKRIEATHTPDEWIGLLGKVAAFDGANDRLRKQAGWTAFLAIVVGFIATVVSGSFIVLLLFAIIFAAALAAYLFCRRNDLSNNLREFVLPFITLLREDIDRGGMLTLKLDLGNPMTKEHQTGQEMLRTRLSTEQTTYELAWLAGSALLADNSTMEMTITDLIRQRKTTKRNARGKTKVKFKYRVRRLIDLRVGFRRDDYALATPKSVRSGDDMKVKEREKRNVLRARRVVESSSVSDTMPVRDVMEILSSVYGRVNLVRQEGN